jgi:hypothetical protein
MDEQPKAMLTKYGLLRKRYLKNEKEHIYKEMLLNGTLQNHLLTIQDQVEQRMEYLVMKRS